VRLAGLEERERIVGKFEFGMDLRLVETVRGSDGRSALRENRSAGSRPSDTPTLEPFERSSSTTMERRASARALENLLERAMKLNVVLKHCRHVSGLGDLG
jgi:hypothetical protein